ncbi:MAG: mycothiol synthase [Nocardioides sp.]|nr:mycothiol synthase [Nocardioides sp.]
MPGLDSRLAETLDAIAAAAREDDGTDPLDEATRLALAHRAEDELTVWLAGPDGDDAFALLVDDDLTLVTRPAARGQGWAAMLLAEVTAVTEGEGLTAWSHGDHPAAVRLAEEFGFTRARDLWVMRLPDLTDLPPLEVPDGIRVRGYVESDAAEVLRINAAAFADHPEQGRMDADDLARRMAEDWFDPAGLLVAEDVVAGGSGGSGGSGDAARGTLLGFHWTKLPRGSAAGAGRRTGEVYVVGIDPAAQGRGLGRLLTLAGLHHLRERGATDVELYVEGDNHAAQRTYSRLGFLHAAADTHVQYRRG